MIKVVHPWCTLGVARSGRESRYLPSESYLGQKERKRIIMMVYLSTFP